MVIFLQIVLNKLLHRCEEYSVSNQQMSSDRSGKKEFERILSTGRPLSVSNAATVICVRKTEPVPFTLHRADFAELFKFHLDFVFGDQDSITFDAGWQVLLDSFDAHGWLIHKFAGHADEWTPRALAARSLAELPLELDCGPRCGMIKV